MVVDNNLSGSIPAHAGEPTTPLSSTSSPGVYPRACGGTAGRVGRRSSLWGLSPRMRGNPGTSRGPAGRRRSIPAHAGEPRHGVGGYRWRRVYPRACGGTSTTRRAAFFASGLSPRMRGNPLHRSAHRPAKRSIPAHAGEPDKPGAQHTDERVYPRACGGTWTGNDFPCRNLGLSPRMRGNLRRMGNRSVLFGSIPAHAGEPRPVGGR